MFHVFIFIIGLKNTVCFISINGDSIFSEFICNQANINSSNYASNSILIYRCTISSVIYP